MRKRTISRECALKVLYQAEIARRAIPLASQSYWAEQEDSKDKVVKEYAERLTNGIEANLAAIDAKITQYATNWQIKRMAVIDRNILRIGVYEMIFSGEVPPKVSINEAVELAKKYGDIESSKFVNGILDKIHKTEVVPQN